MLHLLKSNDRGHADHGWLNAYHSFSFADYYDPKKMGFSILRVINEDRIQGGEGFPTHGHKDMEIITYIIEGALEHKDTLGNNEVIKPGEVQRMTAGTGIRHSEFNHLKDKQTHLLQIWILPRKKNEKPGYDQKNFSDQIKEGDLTLIGSPDGKHDSIVINQDMSLYAGHFKAGDSAEFELLKGRQGWLQLISGHINVNHQGMDPGDGLAITQERKLEIKAHKKSEFLFFDLP